MRQVDIQFNVCIQFDVSFSPDDDHIWFSERVQFFWSTERVKTMTKDVLMYKM